MKKRYRVGWYYLGKPDNIHYGKSHEDMQLVLDWVEAMNKKHKNINHFIDGYIPSQEKA